MFEESETWKSIPGITGVEISDFGNVRMLDRVVSSENKTRFTKGRILKQFENGHGYLQVSIPVDGKWTMKKVHRLVAQAFIPNPDNLPEVNHKNCVRDDNCVENLEWCSSLYNSKYREKFGKSRNHPVFAINLLTLEVSQFPSQIIASRVLGFSQGNICSVIKGNRKQTHGYWFVNADNNAVDITKRKLHDIGETRLKVKQSEDTIITNEAFEFVRQVLTD